MEKRGEITVFLSMILLCVAGLLCVMLESARTAGARWYLQMAAGSSIDSLFSQYHRQLWQEYHLLGLEYESETGISERFQGFLDKYMETENWYPMSQDEIQVTAIQKLTDRGGLWMETEILDYMKYGIWSQLDIKPEEGQGLWEDIREAAGVETVVNSYEKQSDAAWELEMTLEKIYQCLGKQKEYHKQAAEKLAGKDGSGFNRDAQKLEKEIQKIPGLVTTYERQADRLLHKIREMEQEYEGQQGELRTDMNRALGQELENYRGYAEKDGQRRRQITDLKALGDGNRGVISDVKSQVAAIREYLSLLEPEEEDHSDEMWSKAEGRWAQFKDSGLTVQGQKQEEKRGWLAQIRKMADSGLLELVVPSGCEISTTAFELGNLPSAGKGGGETDGKDPVKRVLVNEYCAMHFTDFISERDMGTKEGEDGRGGQRYGMEYLLGGRGSDRENLAEAVKKLLAVREGMNLVYLFSDGQKREEARMLALAITGALGLTPLVEITALFILSIWALGEAIMDIRALLEGGKVPLLKQKGDWYLGLEQLLELGRAGFGTDTKNRDKGLSYSGYVKLLLLAEESERKYYRMMDVMEMKLQRKQPGFRMEFCAYGVDIEAAVCGKHVFFSLPFVEMFTGSAEHGYPIRVAVQKSY